MGGAGRVGLPPAKGRLILTSEAQAAAEADTIIVTIGTPIDEFLNPRMALLADTMEPLLPYLSDDQLLVLRSTVFPGTTEWLNAYLRRHGCRTKVAFCPERI
ncbi:MAG: nucleotide sugar dehydrogenase, partial [Elusimicrobiota bacterium]